MGVHINVVTKSGTNQIHGALVEFLRNQVLDARSFFTLPTPANPTAAKPPLRQNQFGVEFDGPVIIPKIYNGKDKTFFMASYEGFRLVQQSTSLSTQMPAAFFTGNFSSVPASSITGGAIKDPLNGNTPFPGNIIPTGAHLAGCRQAAAVLSGDKPARPGQQFLRAGADHRQIQPDRGPHRSEYRRQNPVVCARPLAGVGRVWRECNSRSTGLPRRRR